MTSGADRIEQQRELYGEPIGDVVRRVADALRLSQSAVSRALGLSPAMLSQLMSGHRVKIGNPLVVARLQALIALADRAAGLDEPELARSIEEIRESRSTLTTSQVVVSPAPDAAATLRDLVRTVASDDEIAEAARALESVAPGLAELVRVYGAGSVEDARRHLAARQAAR